MSTSTKLDIDAIGQRAAARREALGLEQEEMASRSGMSRAYISRFENGLVKAPKLTDLLSVAEALELSLDVLIYGEPTGSDVDILSALDRLPGASIALTSIAKGVKYAGEADREFVVGYLELLAKRLGRDE